jgi:hypothetical protein
MAEGYREFPARTFRMVHLQCWPDRPMINFERGGACGF